MPVDPETLASFAREYAKDMTSIRGRRVQRLLKREFAEAEYVLQAHLGSGAAAVLGLSESGASLCATDGTGKEAYAFPLERLRTQVGVHATAKSTPPRARPLLAKVRDVLT